MTADRTMRPLRSVACGQSCGRRGGGRWSGGVGLRCANPTLRTSPSSTVFPCPAARPIFLSCSPATPSWHCTHATDRTDRLPLS